MKQNFVDQCYKSGSSMVHVFLVKAPYLFFESLIHVCVPFTWFSHSRCFVVWKFDESSTYTDRYRVMFFRNLKASRLCNGTRCSNSINWLCKRRGSTSSHLQKSDYSHRHPTAQQANEYFSSLCLCYVRQQNTMQTQSCRCWSWKWMSLP